MKPENRINLAYFFIYNTLYGQKEGKVTKFNRIEIINHLKFQQQINRKLKKYFTIIRTMKK